MVANVSQREAARMLNLNRKTVVRKFRELAARAQVKFQDQNRKKPLATEIEFDDMETFEHTKCKPVSITLAVEFKTRRILGFEVAQMPAKGKLAALSRKKYGYRRDDRARARQKLFKDLQPLVSPMAKIRSDSNPAYARDVKRFFPMAHYEQILGKRGAITGQGELKKVKWDPIFSLNHTCAMFRASLSRLIRKTWCTTKLLSQLALHLAIYAESHNRRLAPI